MKIELTEQQFRYLLDLVYIGNWVINSTREDDRIRRGSLDILGVRRLSGNVFHAVELKLLLGALELLLILRLSGGRKRT